MQQVSLDSIDAFARTLLASLPATQGACVLALSGDLGAGKTALTQALGRALGVTQKIPSPTFLVMRSYAATHPRFKKLVHIDAYRLDDPRELEQLGFRVLLKEPGVLIAIEWASRVAALLPRDAVHLSLKPGRITDEREVSFGPSAA